MPGKFSRVRAVPWVIVVQTALAANARWRAMAPKDRERLTKLLKTSKGRPANLSAREREDVKRLLGELDLQGVARELGPFMRARRRRRKR